MAGADHVSINSKVTMNKLQKINYKGESRYEYLRKVWFTRQNKLSSPPQSSLKTRQLKRHISSILFAGKSVWIWWHIWDLPSIKSKFKIIKGQQA